MEQNIYSVVFKVTHSGGSGSCFYLKEYNLFVTNYHVSRVSIQLPYMIMNAILIWRKLYW